MKKTPTHSRSPSSAPRTQIIEPSMYELSSPGDGSKDNLITEAACSPPYMGRDNPVFTFDSVSQFSRAPSQVSDIGPAFDIPFRALPPTRRGSYFPFLPGESRHNLVVPAALRAEPGQRRSSFTTLRDSVLASEATLLGRPRPAASVSVDDIRGAERRSVRSPGLFSTASMWSTTDLRRSLAVLNKPELDTTSHVGTASMSNFSGSFSERMHELVRAFSSRTQRARERISQPPTPSSDSDYDAKSAASEKEETKGPRNVRLGSFNPAGSRASNEGDNKEHLVGVWRCKFRIPKLVKKLNLDSTVEPHCKGYVFWLFLVSLAFLYNAVAIPLRGVFPYQTLANVRYWLVVDYFCDAIYILDIFIFKSRLRFVNNGIIETDRKVTRKNYLRKWMFKLDIISLTPLDFLYFIDGVGVNPWLRLPRVLKLQTYWEFYERCDQASRSSAHAIRIIRTVSYMLFLIHVETCGYYAMSVYEGLGTNDWVYSGEGVAYIRCFYLAAKTATSIGNNPTPRNKLEYIFMTFYWLSGVFVFALLIGQIRDIVESATMVKDNYRKKMDSCLWYMQSINLPKEMKDRVKEWFLYNWQQQRTIDERSLVCSLPKKLQTDLAINVHFNTLCKVSLFQDCERNLLYDLVLKLRPILYLPGDFICQKGEVGREMYIVTQGHVEVVGGQNGETVLATLHEGSVFGEISLLAMSGRGNRRTADVRSKGYTNVFTLSKHDFETAMAEYPEAHTMLKRRAKKLLKANAKMDDKKKKIGAEEIIKTPPETPKLVQTVIKIMDPDSNFVKQMNSSVRNSQRNLRSHSRSHSHRLSTTSSNIHHLAPQRSHSFRLPSQPASPSPNPPVSLEQPAVPPTTDGFDTDNDNDEAVYDDSSDDVSLSEVLHDTVTLSSFDDDAEEDDDDDDMKWGRHTASERDGPPNQHWKQAVRSHQSNQKDGTGNMDTTQTAGDVKQAGDGVNLASESRDMSTHGSIGPLDEPPVKVSVSGGIGSMDEPPVKVSVNGGNISKTSNSNGSRSQLRADTAQEKASDRENCRGSAHSSTDMTDNKDFLDATTSTRPHVVVDHAAVESSVDDKKDMVAPRVDCSASNQANLDANCYGQDVSGRVRKVSVVSPPVSPAQTRDKQSAQRLPSNTQIVSLKESSSDLIMRCFTPVETPPIYPIAATDSSKYRPSPDLSRVPTVVATNSPVVTNGLLDNQRESPIEGNIPPENRVTFAVEVHRHKSASSSSADMHKSASSSSADMQKSASSSTVDMHKSASSSTVDMHKSASSSTVDMHKSASSSTVDMHKSASSSTVDMQEHTETTL